MTDVKIIADLKEPEQSRVAVLEDGKLTEIFIDYNFSDEYDEEDNSPHEFLAPQTRQGDIFKARIDTIVPAITAAFVALTSKTTRRKNDPRNAFLYLNEAPNPEALKSGKDIIVQVTKNARKNKAPRVSPRISVPGRWLVLVPESDEVGVSRRIFDNLERKRLKKIADDLKAELPGFGIIIRTAAENISEELLRADLKSLLDLWGEIHTKAENTPGPCLLYRDTGTLGKVLRDEISGNISEIIIDNPEEYEQAKSFVERFYPEKPSVNLYSGITPIFEYFGIEEEINKALERKVWLRSGAYLVIDQTEALTVIDVNTGKFTSAPDMRHTVLATNLEAAEEIARQLRLRSIGGIIIIDFIDMELNEDKQELLKHFDRFLRHDRLKPHVFSITQLGLVELTRKRERPDLRSILTRNCPVCNDNGFVEREENIAMKVKRFIRKITSANNSEAFIIQTAPATASYIYKYLDEWQEEFNRKIFIASMQNFNWNKYRLEYQGNLKGAEAHAKNLRTQGNKIFRT
ncbi:MAG: Rne/Rng family ribonuclease [Synergistaceae bacterium]|nr:Rne/Rng family ribonuclease [Synergistaceae bacterium]